MNKYFLNHSLLLPIVFLLLSFSVFSTVHAQEETPQPEQTVVTQANAGPARRTLVDKTVTFDKEASIIPEGTNVEEFLWDFGDTIRTTGDKVTHAYTKPGTYKVTLTIKTNETTETAATTVDVFSRVIILLADNSATDEQLELQTQQAAKEGILLYVIKSKTSGTEALVEEELTQALTTARAEVSRANLIVTWTSGAIGPNVLSRFAQTVRQTDDLTLTNLDFDTKGIYVLTDTSFAFLAPTAQSTFDQLTPSYVALTRPDALPLLYTITTAEEARTKLIDSPVSYRILGSFSSRTTKDINLTNFMSYGINYLINQGVPINNIVLILMLPVIATLLAFARQVIGIKAFGLITPAMTTLSFLVLGLPTGLIVFVVVLLTGTVTRFLLRKLRLLYLPRMALVLSSASFAILIMLGVGATLDNVSAVSFSIFPILILTVLAEEFIAAQFSQGLKIAMRITSWTLLLAILCYFIMSWQLLRVTLLSYPELALLAIPINIGLGRFTGLRLFEYIRFRELLRHKK